MADAHVRATISWQPEDYRRVAVAADIHGMSANQFCKHATMQMVKTIEEQERLRADIQAREAEGGEE